MVMVFASFNAHTPPNFKKLNIMTFDNIYNYFVSTFMFKVTKHINAQIFDSMSVHNKIFIIIELDMLGYTVLL